MSVKTRTIQMTRRTLKTTPTWKNTLKNLEWLYSYSSSLFSVIINQSITRVVKRLASSEPRITFLVGRSI